MIIVGFVFNEIQ